MNNTIFPVLILILALVAIVRAQAILEAVCRLVKWSATTIKDGAAQQPGADLLYQVNYWRMNEEKRQKAADHQARAEAQLNLRTASMRPPVYDPVSMKPVNLFHKSYILGNEDDITNENPKS